MEKTRNYNIDFLRGIASLAIIMIHTAFHSGNLYIESKYATLSLLIDVPAFILISGMTFTYTNSIMKAINSCIDMWKKWVYFLIYFILIIFIWFRNDFKYIDIFNYLGYITKDTALMSVYASIWFSIMFMKVVLIGSIIIYSVNKTAKENSVIYLKSILFFIFIIYLHIRTTGINGNKVFLFLDQETIFYLGIYILGYILNSYKIKNFLQFIFYEILAISSVVLILKIFNFSIGRIAILKFPPDIHYLLYSSISIILFWYLKDAMKIKKKNAITYVGQNAIFFYYAQGVSSSILFIIYKYVANLPILQKFSILAFSNYLMATIFAVFLSETYHLLQKGINKMIEKNKFEILKPEKIEAGK